MFIYGLVTAFVAQQKLGGLVFVSGYHLKIRDGTLRRPDVLYLTPEQNALSEREFTRNAQWVAEVVSEDDPRRDYVKKRADYAACGVKEYWIVDPRKRLVTILFLEAGAYVERGSFGDGQRLASILFDGLTVGVSELFAAGEQ